MMEIKADEMPQRRINRVTVVQRRGEDCILQPDKVKQIYKLALDSVALIGVPHAERKRRGSLKIYNEWKKIRTQQFIKGLR